MKTYNVTSLIGVFMKYLVFLVLFISVFGFRVEAQATELSVTMKNIGHLYKKALKSEDPKATHQYLDELITLIEKSKKANFKQGTEIESVEGLNKVIASLKLAQDLNAKGDTESFRKTLLKVDELRKQYHKLHEPPTFWQLIFG